MRANVLLIIGLLGCGSSGAVRTEWQSPAASRPEARAAVQPAASATSSSGGEAIAGMPIAPVMQIEGLPAAPWSSIRLVASEAPSALMSAWSEAENRAWCAPASVASGADATARAAQVYGGWSVEFDQAGVPGVRPDGRACPRCGRAAFGIVGTAMSPEDAIDPDAEAPPAPTFADGSRAEIIPAASRGEAASATVVVAGQGCVYQVWSFLGEEHLQTLLSSFRLVEVTSDVTQPAVAALSN